MQRGRIVVLACLWLVNCGESTSGVIGEDTLTPVEDTRPADVDRDLAEPLCSSASQCPTPSDACLVATCASGACGTAPRDCDDDDACTQDMCTASACVHEPTVGCGSACTSDAQCAASMTDVPDCRRPACLAGTCLPVPVLDGATCAPAVAGPCVAGGRCLAGGCQPVPVLCADGDVCTAESCEPVTGGCVSGPAIVGCNATCSSAGDCAALEAALGPCQTATCLDGRCKPTAAPIGTTCPLPKDAPPCAALGVCTPDGCQVAAKPCDDDDPCTLDGCAPGSGQCKHFAVAGCDLSCQTTADCAGKGLVTATCDALKCQGGQCVTTPAADGLPCAPPVGGPCVIGGACHTGLCFPVVPDCAGDEGCLAGACQCLASCAGMVCGDDGCGGSCGTCGDGTACVAGACTPTCTPSCFATSCGDDGCGGSCGTCGATEACLSGACEVPCAPSCDGSACGDDGCGGSCGACAADEACVAGACVVPCTPACGLGSCGDDGCGGSCGLCSAVESCTGGECAAACVPDCYGQGCGDDGCGGSCGVCAADQACLASGACETPCAPDCAGRTCGDDGCGGVCGVCGVGEACLPWGLCEAACAPNCAGRVCGDNGCGGVCGSCGEGQACSEAGLCEPACSPDCTNRHCGDDGCGGSCGSCEGGEGCSPGGQCGTPCTANCGTKTCGLNGCGGQCGLCGTGQRCQAGACVAGCTPSCGARECGPDGCGGSCGACTGEVSCSTAGVCVAGCKPACDGKSCGPDGCGGVCGICGVGEQCVSSEGQCVPLCTPSCAGKSCGDNGCGGSCGACGGGGRCLDGQCVAACTPDCVGSACGPDGCGGTCGVCGADERCTASGQCAPGCGPVCGACGENGCGGTCGACGAGKSCVAGQCQAGCAPSCAGKTCGDDGCGGSCGTCPGGAVCRPDGTCTCVPSCDGKTCGDNGCGGSCGVCEPGQTCALGACSEGCTPSCDGKGCGPDACGGTCGTCADGLACVGGHCACVPSCDGKTCGDNGCGGSCGSCAAGESCVGDACVEGCLPTCAGVSCGPDGCGGQCGSCPSGTSCVSGACVCLPSCAGKACGDNGCGGTCGGCPAGQSCSAGTCLSGCAPSCMGKACGADGCGGTCGSCTDGAACTAAGQCACAPSCAGKSCGDNGCGGSCGSCPTAQACVAGQCLVSCAPSCAGKHCGPDGCGGTCGACAAGQACNATGTCGCAPACAGKTCGPDGCGGTCGACGPGLTCSATGQCGCVAACAGKECGPDGCGGACGACGGGESCSPLGQCGCVPQCGGRECGDDGCGGSCGACAGGSACAPYGLCVASCGGACTQPSCGGTVGGTELCNAIDDDCDGQVDEGCGSVSCGGAEKPDDGQDSDCNGYETFRSDKNNLRLLQPLSEGPFAVPVAGDFHMGLIGTLPVTGTLERAAAVTWCLAGGDPDRVIGEVELANLSAQGCRLADGTFAGSYSADLVFQGGLQPVTGTFGPDASDGLKVVADTLHLGPGLVLTTVDLDVQGGANKPTDENVGGTTLSATLAIGSGASQLTLDVSGTYVATGDCTLDVVMHEGTAWQPFDTLPLALSDASGTLTRTAGVWTLRLDAGADTLVVAPGLELTQASVAAQLLPGGRWALQLSGMAELGPLTATVSGTLQQAGPGQPVTGCLAGSASGTVPGLTLGQLTVSACLGAGPTVTVSVSGEVSLGAAPSPFDATLVLGPPWTLTLQMDSVALSATLPPLTHATLIVPEAAVSFPLSGRLTLPSGGSGLLVAISGSWTPSGAMTLAIAKLGTAPWMPFPGLPLSFSTFSGALARTAAGAWSITITASAAQTTLVSGLVLTTATATGTLTSTGAWSVLLSGRVTLTGLVLDLSGTLSQASPTAPVTGCLSGGGTGTVTGLGVLTVTAQACFSSGALTAITLSGSLTIGTAQVAVTGTYTLSPARLVVTAPVIDLVPGLIRLEAVTFTTVPGLPTQISATLVLPGVGGNLGLRVTGTWRDTGDLSLTITQTGGAGWQPFSTVPITLSGLGGTLRRTGGIWSVTLTGSAATAIIAPSFTLTNITGSTTIAQGTGLSLALSATGVVGPFTVALSGTLSAPTPTGTVTGCLEGTVAKRTLAGVPMSSVHVRTCWDAAGVTVTVDGSLTFEGATTSFTGTLTTAAPWTLSVSFHNVPLLPGLILDDVTLTLVDGGTSWALHALATVGSGASALRLTVDGTYTTVGAVTLTVALKPGTTWTPFTGFTVTTLTGTLKRTSGAWSLSVSTTGITSVTLAPGFVLSSVTFSGAYASSGTWTFTLAGMANLGLFGQVSLSGNVQQTAPGAPITACLTGAAQNLTIAGITLSSIQVTSCSGTTANVTFGAVASIDGKPYQVTGSATLGQNPAISFTISAFRLAPGIIFDSITFTLNASGCTVVGTLRVGSGATAATLRATGTFISNGDFSLTIGLAPGTTWDPFGAQGAALTTATGTLSRTSGVISLSISASLGATLEILPGFTLKNPQVGGTVSGTGTWIVSISGTFHIVMGVTAIDVLVSATVGSDAVMVFTGTYAAAVKPFGSPIQDLVTVSDLDVSVIVDTNASTFSVSFGGTIDVCLFAPCAPGTSLVLDTEGGLVAGAQSGVWFRAAVPSLSLPLLGTMNNLALVVTSVALPSFDVFDTPNKASDDLDVAPGLLLYTFGQSPVQLGATSETLLFSIAVTPTSMAVQASYKANWRVISPANNFPGIQYFDFKGMVLGGELRGASAALYINATAELKPDNQPSPLTGTVEFGLVIGAGVQLELTAYVNGRWYDCFGLDSFAIQNPGLTMKILTNPPPVPPVPTSIGFNLDVYWRRIGNTWPSETVWPVPVTQPAPPPPSGISQMGATFYYDTNATPSGLCLFGACPPLPPFLFRVDVHNLTWPSDVLNLWDDLFTDVIDFMPGEVPDGFLPDLDTSPLAVDFDHMQVYASTHDLNLFGMQFKPGFLAELDLNIATTPVHLSGFADSRGITVEGSVAPFDLLGLDLVTFLGDPFRRFAEPKTGWIEVPDDNRLDLTTGTIEGFARVDTLATDPMGAVFAKKLDASNGWAIGIGAVAGGKGKVTVQLRKNGQTRTLQTTTAPISASKKHHLAVVMSSTTAGIFVDGVRQATTSTGAATGAGASTAKLTLGVGCRRIDDVRLWNTQRTRADLRGESRYLPYGYIGDPELVARYEMDFDDDGLGVAYSTRHYTSGGQLHGTYVADASTRLDFADQDLWFKLALRLPSLLDAADESPGFWAQAGVILDIPFLGEIETGLQVNIGDGHAAGQFYAKDFTLLPMPGIGDFKVGGYGPNIVPADFDDGFFAAVDLIDLSFAATAKLSFEEVDGDEQVIGGASVSFQCPNGQVCDSAFDHVFEAHGDIDMTVAMPLSLGDLGMKGSADAVLNSPNWHMAVSGDFVVFDLEFLQVSLRVDSERVAFQSAIDFGSINLGVTQIDLGSIVCDLTFTYDTFELCGDGMYTQAEDGDFAAGFTCGLGFCVGGPGIPIRPSFGCGGVCVGPEFCDQAAGEICLFGVCAPPQPLGAACGKNSHCGSGNCGCISNVGGLNVGVCYEPNSKPMGADCQVDAECTTGRCSAELCIPGKCVCDDDQDCGSGKYCDQGITLGLGTNSCVQKRSNGSDCTADHFCASGHCSTQDAANPCGYCYPNANKAVGQQCRVNAECASNRCGYVCGAPGWGECKCDVDSQCPQGYKCRNGPLDDHECHIAKGDGESCTADNQCLSGACGGCADIDGLISLGWCYTPNSRGVGQECYVNGQCANGMCGAECVLGVFFSGVCHCSVDSECAGNEYCDGGDCHPKKNRCEECDNGRKCKSDYCTANISGKCVVPDSKDLGQSCCHDDECTTGRCHNDLCECVDDGDCGSGRYCDNNTCYTKKEDCETCDRSGKCESSYCTASVSGKCVTRDSKVLGNSCCHDEQCQSDKCSDGHCVCNDDGDCGSGRHCDDSTCYADLGDHASCNEDSDCASNVCGCLPSAGHCVTLDHTQGTGTTCYKDDECVSDRCSSVCGLSSGKCVCDVDNDCQDNYYCDTGFLTVGTNTCKAQRDIGDGCDNDRKCKSNCCKGLVGFQECQPAGDCN